MTVLKEIEALLTVWLKSSQITGMNRSFSNSFYIDSHSLSVLFHPVMHPAEETWAITEQKAFSNCTTKSILLLYKDLSLNLRISKQFTNISTEIEPYLHQEETQIVQITGEKEFT